jgi:hypothetical protein
MKAPSSLCPVPDEQQPINEYQQLRESWFYSWVTRDLRGYITPIVVLWCGSWLISGPVASVSFPIHKDFLHFCLSASVGALLIPGLALLQVYLGWGYVADRLQRQSISYEESGWYDGQVWDKPDDMLQRDRLVFDYDVKPLLKRLQQTFGIGGLIIVGIVAIWLIG